MRVAIITDERIARLGAGDWMQARQTCRAMRELAGVSVDHFLVDCQANTLRRTEESDNVPISRLRQYEVCHAIPAIRGVSALAGIAAHRGERSLLVASPIFWDSFAHRLICAYNDPQSWPVIFNFFANRVGLRRGTRDAYSLYDLLLFNSEAEVRSFRKRGPPLPNGVQIGVVPNGIEPLPAYAHACERPKQISSNEYIVYPGVFSPRKNQLGFICAMERSPRTVIFLGGALPSSEASARYYAKCRATAPDRYVFMGPVPHYSEEFFGALRHARVACLASSCETPGLALLEAAALGTRVVAPMEGSALEYFGAAAEYVNPLRPSSIRETVNLAWQRGRLSLSEMATIQLHPWIEIANSTVALYRAGLSARRIANCVRLP